MTKEEVYSKLCYYDPRNPDNNIEFGDDRVPGKDCYCDNCFYGRAKLAEYILELQNVIDHHRKARNLD